MTMNDNPSWLEGLLEPGSEPSVQRLDTKMEDKKFTVLVDDIRSFGVDVICRTYDVAVRILAHLPVEHLYLDHDLGCFDEEKGERTGYDIVNFLEGVDPKPDRVTLVTDNPSGRVRMGLALEAMGYKPADFLGVHREFRRS